MAAQQAKPYSATIAGDGTATITIQPQGQSWRVSQVSVEQATAPAGATCALRLQHNGTGVLVTPLVPTGDAAGGDPPITITGFDALTVEWEHCTPGEPATALVLYEVIG
jgi:hypothetical protein